MRNLLITVLICSACFLMPLACVHRTESSHSDALETLLDMFDMEETLKQSVDQMVVLQVQQNPQLGLYRDVLRKFYAKHMSWDKLKEEFIAIYMDEFSEDEIRELIVFYRTQTGQKVIKKLPLLMSKCAQIGNKRIRDKMPEWYRMLQDETERLQKLQEREEMPSRSGK